MAHNVDVAPLVGREVFDVLGAHGKALGAQHAVREVDTSEVEVLSGANTTRTTPGYYGLSHDGALDPGVLFQ